MNITVGLLNRSFPSHSYDFFVCENFYFQRDTSLVHTITEEKYMDHIRACLMVAEFYLEREHYLISKKYFRGAMGVACTFRKKKKEVVTM